MGHGSSNPVWATCRQLPCPVVPIDEHHALSHRSHTHIPHHSRDLHLERRILPNGCLGAYIGSNHLHPGNAANALRGVGRPHANGIGSNHARLQNNVSLHGRPNCGTGDLPQPVPFSRTFFCQDCSNQFRDPRVQSVLDYPPPPSAPLFWLVSRKPCMESPNQYLSPEPSFATIAPTSFEIQGSKVCSTIRPLTLPHCFGWFQGNHVWKAPTSTFHRNLLLPGLLQPVSRSKGPKCARLSAPSLCATVLVGFKETMYGKPQPVPFTRTFFCHDCSNQFRDPRVQSVLDYPPTHSAPPFWLVSRKPCMESPNQYLSLEPSFATIAPTSFEIQGSKVCSTIRPDTGTTSTSWAGSMNGCQQAVQVQLQFISVPRMGIYTSLSVLPLRLRLTLRLCLVRGLGLGLRGHNEENQLPWPGITPMDEG